MSEPTLPILDYGMARRWWRRNVNWESSVAFLKELLPVSLLTVLIWLYAVNEQVYTEQGQPVPIRLKTSEPNRAVTIEGAGNETVTVDLNGPRAKVDAVKQALASAGPDAAIPIEVASTLQPGLYQISTQTIKEAPIFLSNGVSVENIHPQSIPVRIDTYQQIEVPVQAPEPNNFTSFASDPRTVRIRGSRTLLTSPEHQKELVAIADTTAIPKVSEPGNHGPTTVPVTSPLQAAASTRGETITISPSQINATVTVERDVAQKKIETVPVWPEAADSVSNEFRVDCPAFFVPGGITVTGPREMLNQIGKEPFIPHATLPYYRDDATKEGKLSRTLVFENRSLPPGVVVSSEDRNKPFEFRVVPRNAPKSQ